MYYDSVMYTQSGKLYDYLTGDFESLRLKGYMVIPNVISNVDFHKQNILNDISKHVPRHVDTRLIQDYGSGQWESTWKCRLETLPVWNKLFKTDSLLSSFDGITYVPRQQLSDLGQELNVHGEPTWMHRDQNICNTNFADTIQGFVSLTNANEESYSTVFFQPRENETAENMIYDFHQKFCVMTTRSGRVVPKRISFDDNKNDDDYHPFDETQLEWWRQHSRFVKPNLKKGDMLLWLSSMPHAGATIPNSIAHDLTEDRLGIFVSMLPKTFATIDVLRNRRELAKTGATSTHNVIRPRIFKTPVAFKVDYTDPILAKSRTKLIG